MEQRGPLLHHPLAIRRIEKSLGSRCGHLGDLEDLAFESVSFLLFECLLICHKRDPSQVSFNMR